MYVSKNLDIYLFFHIFKLFHKIIFHLQNDLYRYTHYDHWTNNKTFKIWNESMCTFKNERKPRPKMMFWSTIFQVFFLDISQCERKESWDASLEFYHLNHMILKIDFIGAIAIIWSFSRVMVKIKWSPKYSLISRMEDKNNEWLPYRMLKWILYRETQCLTSFKKSRPLARLAIMRNFSNRFSKIGDIIFLVVFCIISQILFVVLD